MQENTYRKPTLESLKLEALSLAVTQTGLFTTEQFSPCTVGRPLDEWNFQVSNLGSSPQITAQVQVTTDPTACVTLKVINTDGAGSACSATCENSQSIVFTPAGDGIALIQIFANGFAIGENYNLSITSQDCDISNLGLANQGCTTGACT